MQNRITADNVEPTEIESLVRQLYLNVLTMDETELNDIVNHIYRAKQSWPASTWALFFGNDFPAFHWGCVEKDGHVLLKRKMEFVQDRLTEEYGEQFSLKLLDFISQDKPTFFPPELRGMLHQSLIKLMKEEITLLEIKIEANVRVMAMHTDLTESLLRKAEEVGMEAAGEKIDDFIQQEILLRKKRFGLIEEIKTLNSTKEIKQELVRQMEADHKGTNQIKAEIKIEDNEIQPGLVKARSKELKTILEQSKIIDTQPKDVPDHAENFQNASDKLAQYYGSTIIKRK